MIVTDRFAFIHMHKTGGQTLNEAITTCIPDHRVVGYHFPRAELPAECSELPVVGIVRNPWDWYVSWYAFNRRPGIGNPLFNIVSDNGAADLKTTITNLVELGSDSDESGRRRERLIEILPDTLDGNRGVGLTKASIGELASSDSGYLSWLFARMLGEAGDERTFVGRFENLQQDFLSIMSELSVPEHEQLAEHLATGQRRNVSRHTHYSHYFDDELCDLVAAKDQSLIERFDYEFDSLKPSGSSYAFPEDAYTAPNDSFKKLLGREQNFLQLCEDVPVAAIKEKLDALPDARWKESERERLFDVHRDTEALLLVHFEDHKYKEPDYRELYDEFRDVVDPVVQRVADYYKNNGFIVRLILAKLVAGGKIPRHTDSGHSLLDSHRVHLPIITNDDVDFFVGGDEINMRAGELWEINNGTVHAVENRGDADRVHLIVDWMPNYGSAAEAEVLLPEAPGDAAGMAPGEASIGAMIERGHQMQKAGHLDKAESLYRQVVHFDEKHVIGNNLLGLLCLQTRRFEEAVRYIATALNEKPDDAQAHANLALALRNLGRPQEAVRHFQESLQLAPHLPRTHANLGSLLVEQGKVAEAVPLYQKALSIQWELPEVHFNLGNAHLHLQQFAEAAASFSTCLSQRPDIPGGQEKLAEARAGLAKSEAQGS